MTNAAMRPDLHCLTRHVSHYHDYNCCFNTVATGARQVQVPAERVTSLEFSPDGASLAAACWGGTVSLYHLVASLDTLNPAEALIETTQSALRDEAPTEHCAAGTAGSVASAQRAGHGAAVGHSGSFSAALPHEEPVGQPAASTAGRDSGALKAREDAAGGEQSGNSPAPHEGAGSPQRAIAKAEGLNPLLPSEVDAAGGKNGSSPAPKASMNSPQGARGAAEGLDPLLSAEAAHESRLAAIDHGAAGSGGWRIGTSLLATQPVKPGRTGPSLLSWINAEGILLMRCGTALQRLQLEGSSLVRGRCRQNNMLLCLHTSMLLLSVF